MDREKLKAELAGSGKWSETYTQMFHKIIDSAGKGVRVGDLSAILAPEKFRAATFMGINNLLKIRSIPRKLIVVDDDGASLNDDHLIDLVEA